MKVSSNADIDELERKRERNVILQINPEAELVRDDDAFLSRIINFAKPQNLPVEIAGSILGHAYYRLRSEGLIVLQSEPYSSYQRTRGRKSFNKIVRDDIPKTIAAKGEAVVQAQLSERHIERGLVAKLLEEAMEFLNAKTELQKQEELADVLEVLRGMVSSSNLRWEEVTKVADKKRSARGGFEQQTVLLETSFSKPSLSSSMKDKVVRPASGEAIATRRELSLDQLGSVRIRQNTLHIPFTKLIALEGVPAGNLRAADIQVHISAKLEGTGISISVTPGPTPEEPQASQLSLDLEPAPTRVQPLTRRRRPT